ncbi:MAG: hypothetical protein EPO24_15850 [Bacteroidetes bacterium]|nr:MAG: hypothetical protein EPO24_15850 [Bacteroidota bacterium]
MAATNSETKFQELVGLLVKVETSKRHCKIEVLWDGKEFKWTFSAGGLRASEWNPAQQFARSGSTECVINDDST